jgi:hypothetical protein
MKLTGNQQGRKRDNRDRSYWGLVVAMETLGQYLKRMGHRVGWLGIIIFMLLILIWVRLATR